MGSPRPLRCPHDGIVAANEFKLGRSVEGRHIRGYSLGSGDDVVLIMATIHGNESAGTPLVHMLRSYLEDHPALFDGRRIILVPVANPDGLAHRTRRNARGVDLNRNFPACNWSSDEGRRPCALSEPESQALHQLVNREIPARIVSIHQPLACIDYDGPGSDLARAMAERCELPLQKLGALPGSLGSYAGLTRNTPIVTVELPAQADHLDDAILWERYGEMLLTAICYPERAPERPELARPPISEAPACTAK